MCKLCSLLLDYCTNCIKIPPLLQKAFFGTDVKETINYKILLNIYGDYFTNNKNMELAIESLHNAVINNNAQNLFDNYYKESNNKYYIALKNAGINLDDIIDRPLILLLDKLNEVYS